MIDVDFKGFRYHKPIPNFYKIDNPINPKTEISDDLLIELDELAKKYNFTGISYSKLSDDFKKDLNIDIDNVLIFKFLMGVDLINMEPSSGFNADLIHPLDDNLSLRAIAMQSNDCVITRSNMCYFKDGLHNSFFMIHTSIENLPFKTENDMLWVPDFCSTCGVCIERCPKDAFDENEKLLRKVCTAHREGCNECILRCPFFKRGYDKVKKRYDRMKKRSENV